MNDNSRVTSGERTTDALLRFAPPIAFLLVALPAPIFFLFRYFMSGEDAAVWMLFALTSFGVGAVAGLMLALFLVFYRRYRLRALRDRLARDGITVDELPWFMNELTSEERRTLKSIENRLLADAYRESLAARLSATRLAKQSTRELAAVERRSRQAQSLHGSERSVLMRELEEDRARLRGVRDAAGRRQAEAETRLQSIAASASRHRTEAETRIALERLDAAGTTPHALEGARLQREYEAQSLRELEARDRNQLS